MLEGVYKKTLKESVAWKEEQWLIQQYIGSGKAAI